MGGYKHKPVRNKQNNLAYERVRIQKQYFEKVHRYSQQEQRKASRSKSGTGKDSRRVSWLQNICGNVYKLIHQYLSIIM